MHVSYCVQELTAPHAISHRLKSIVEYEPEKRQDVKVIDVLAILPNNSH